MSIPPLVCSSPPPPEQCEDDKEPEDYDFEYHSQPDEDEDSSSYNYDNYNQACMFKTDTDDSLQLKIKESFDQNISSKLSHSSDVEVETINFNTNVNNTIYKNSELAEETALEDLNLEISTIDLQANNLVDKDVLPMSDSIEAKVIDEGETDLVEINNIERNYVQNFTQQLSENEELQVLASYEVDISLNDKKQSNDECTLPNINGEVEQAVTETNYEETITENLCENIASNVTVDEDDFGDFDSFQCPNPDTINIQSHAILNSQNPWENNNTEIEEFETFTANFDSEQTSTIASEKILNERRNDEYKESTNSDDGFEDFDSFKSSGYNESSQKSEDVISCNNVLTICKTDNELQIIENVKSVVDTIFPEEITGLKDSLVDQNLESILGETWGYIMETDVRQPYMVNWNNSLGQKSLLKALCIDSRNILFGSRWNFNTPKYAANLTTLPLQPQKQPAMSNSDNSEQGSKKDANTWIDPFTPHGQEYTYAEALLLDLEHLMATLDQMAHKHSTLKISELLSHACNAESEKTVADVEVKNEDAVASELPDINKIYSSTLSVQPVRQINLPDTHIFTPTDSETPRSKTIHYDNNTIPLVTNHCTDVSKNHTQPGPSVANEMSTKNDEYWCFQHFKENIDTTSLKEESIKSLVDVQTTKKQETMATQILQPIKLEPITPTLNWPDPGEVKEAFYDFSGFTSNTATSTNNSQNILLPTDQVNKNDSILTANVDNFEDDFETFQSAPVTINSDVTNSSFSSFHIVTSTEDTPKSSTINADISKSENNIKFSEVLSIGEEKNSKLEPHEYISKMPNSFSSPMKPPFGAQVNSLTVLQPSNASVVSNQQSTGQILQPLSLEGFSQINWPNPGIDLHDLSRFNPIESVHSLKSDSSAGHSKVSTPVHNPQSISSNEVPDDDIWGDFVSSAPPKKFTTSIDDDEWTDFVSSPNVKPQNGLNTISLNVQTSLNLQKSSNHIKYASRQGNQLNLDIPTLSYITPKSGSRSAYADKHIQNL